MKGRRQSEQLARFRINNTLAELGWRLDDRKGEAAANVRFERDLKNPEDVKRLKRGSPDYVLYSDDSDVPIGIIEAKTPTKKYRNLSDGLEQGMAYAKLLGRENMVVFCSDGNVTVARHASGEILTINGEVVDELLSQEQVAQLAGDPNIESGAIITSMGELVSIFNKASNDLRGDGVEAGLDALREFCLILFVKIMSERKTAPAGCGWGDMAGKMGGSLLVAYRRIVAQYRKLYGDIFNEVKIREARTLEKITEGITDINFSTSPLDIKGGAYEYFLSRYSAGRKSVLGQYFTPRHITRMMAKLLDLRPGNTVYDPFCGTGGMLISCYRLIRSQIAREDKAAIRQLNKKTLYGRDITESASRLAKMNMILLGDGHTNIQCVDSVSNPVRGKYDSVITNIPFNMPSADARTADFYDADSADFNTLCVLHCMRAVRKGGNAAIIVPANMAYSREYQNFRDYVRDNCEIRAAIRLPKSLFKSYTAARACILLLGGMWEKSTLAFPMVPIDNDGFSATRNREPIDKNDIPVVLEYAGRWEERYPQKRADKDFKFFDESRRQGGNAEDSWALRELLNIKTEKTPLERGKFYTEPHIHSFTNTVWPRGEERQGSNISEYREGKIIVMPGDLIIGTLHTQRGHGLFAFADREYIATSQIVATVREDIVHKDYLRFMLRQVLPTLEKDDLVGRETYTQDEILSLRIPKPSNHKNLAQKILPAGKKIAEGNAMLSEAEGEFRDL